MKFRTGLIIGGALGYYLGAKAGRQRYEQLNGWLHRVTDSETVQSAADRVKTTVARNGSTFGGEPDVLQPEWTG